MKYFSGSLIFSLAAIQAVAATTLEIKLKGSYFPTGNREVQVNVPALNKQLKKAGLDPLPETLVITTKPTSLWRLVLKRIAAANQLTGREMHFTIHDDSYGEGYIYNLEICYRGEITDVPELVEAMNGNFLHPDQGILAIAAGEKKILNQAEFKDRDGFKEFFEDNYESNLTNIDKWLKYKPKSGTALVLSNYGPQGDGTELEATEIPACP